MYFCVFAEILPETSLAHWVGRQGSEALIWARRSAFIEIFLLYYYDFEF